MVKPLCVRLCDDKQKSAMPMVACADADPVLTKTVLASRVPHTNLCYGKFIFITGLQESRLTNWTIARSRTTGPNYYYTVGVLVQPATLLLGWRGHSFPVLTKEVLRQVRDWIKWAFISGGALLLHLKSISALCSPSGVVDCLAVQSSNLNLG